MPHRIHPAARRLACTLASALALLAAPAGAYELHNADGDQLNADLTLVHAWLNSQRNYDGRPGGSSWREGYAKFGLSGSRARPGAGTWYGTLNAVSSATWGDGDPGGYSDGSERRTRLEDAAVGWRSGDTLPALGQDGLDLSVGRQAVKIGSGFLVMDDGFNPGRRLAGDALDRGGAYYIAARHAFAGTAVLKLGGQDGLHGSAMWLKSGNHAQADTEVAAATLDYTAPVGTLGLTYLRGLDVDARYASPAQLLRKGMDVFSLRGEGSAGIQNARFAFEIARQNTDAGHATAGYVQAGYAWPDAAWAPNLRYRYARHGQGWDSLFTGGYRAWLQGEVAANYAGPFNTNASVQQLVLDTQPAPTLTLGVALQSYRTLRDRQTLKLDARELNLFAEWTVHPHLIVAPMLGLYKPRQDATNGGNQNRRGTNVYAQLLLIAPF